QAHPSPELRSWCAGRLGAAERERNQKHRITAKGAVELVQLPLRNAAGAEPPELDPAEADAVWIGRHPVTNAQYALYLEANPSARPPRYWNDRRFNAPRQPVVGVPWDDAQRFARWAGCRLPSKTEWEYAANPQGGERAELPANGEWSGASRPVGQ